MAGNSPSPPIFVNILTCFPLITYFDVVENYILDNKHTGLWVFFKSILIIHELNDGRHQFLNLMIMIVEKTDYSDTYLFFTHICSLQSLNLSTLIVRWYDKEEEIWSSLTLTISSVVGMEHIFFAIITEGLGLIYIKVKYWFVDISILLVFGTINYSATYLFLDFFLVPSFIDVMII